MNVGIKQRLIGALVLLAIGVIAWSVLFDPSQVGQFSRRSEIPPAPEFERVEIDLARPDSSLPRVDFDERNREQLAAQQAAGADTESADAQLEVNETNRPATPTDTALPALWAVQVGSFGRAENAQGLKQQLESAGYHVIVQHVDGDSGRMTRLFVDPKMDKASADRLHLKIDQQFDTRSVVVRYYPN